MNVPDGVRRIESELHELDIADMVAVRKDKAGSYRKLAKELGLSASYLSEVANGIKPPSDNLCSRLGIVRTTHYRYFKSEGIHP